MAPLYGVLFYFGDSDFSEFGNRIFNMICRFDLGHMTVNVLENSFYEQISLS